MNSQIDSVIADKVASSVMGPRPVLTWRDAPLPKVRNKAIAVIGMRRAGKTSYLHQVRAQMIDAGRPPEQLIYFNFEDERLGGMRAADLSRVPDVHARMYPAPEGERVALFLDEIQLVPGWEVFVRRMLDTPHYEIFLSGSSAKLLSREIATSMRGRGWELPIHPFSFREFARFHELLLPTNLRAVTSRQAAGIERHFERYLSIGGFPEAQVLDAPDRRALLQNYVDVVMLRDVIERHEVSNPTALRWLVRRLLSQPAGTFSVTKFMDDLKSQNIKVGREFLYEYLSHLEDTFLVQTIPVASDSEKRKQVNPRKVYPADTGLIPVFDRSGKANTGHALELAVFIELQRRRASVAYVKTDQSYEVDFLATMPNGNELLVQVCASIDEDAVREREVRALQAAHTLYPKAQRLLLTLQSRTPYPKVPRGIRVLPAWQWMLESA